MSHDFWDYLQQLVDMSEIVIDRPAGSAHPRYPLGRLPAHYGYLQGTTTLDGGGIDIWVGSLGEKRVVGALCTVDLLKRDTELKILYDCKNEEIKSILDYVNAGNMRAISIERTT
jgi:inorganic pyrophosphatase